MKRAFAARLSTSFAATLAATIALIPTAARADMVGGDIPLLTALVANGADQLAQLSKHLAELERLYTETRRLAGYADEAAHAFNAVRSLNGELFGRSVLSGLDQAFPEVGRIQREVADGSGWAGGTGELGALAVGCARGGACSPLLRAVSAEDARRALGSTFGDAPEGSKRAQAMDSEASVGLAASSSQVGRNQVTRAQMARLLEQCAGTGDGTGNGTGDEAAEAACQAAANAAQIQAVAEQSYLSDQASLQTRLQSDQLAQANADHKAAVARSDAERKLLRDALELGRPRATAVRTLGVDILGGEP